jgi:hypothetical protein
VTAGAPLLPARELYAKAYRQVRITKFAHNFGYLRLHQNERSRIDAISVRLEANPYRGKALTSYYMAGKEPLSANCKKGKLP